MKLPQRLCYAGALLCAAVLHAVAADITPPAAVTAGVAPTAADRDWAALEDFLKTPLPATVSEMPPAQRLLLMQWQMISRCVREMDFVENHPDDPRRWLVVHRLTDLSPFFKGWELNAQGELRPIPDEHATAAWKSKVAALKAAMATAPDLPDSLREAVKQEVLLQAVMKALAVVAKEGTTANFAAARALIDEFGATVTDPRVAGYGGAITMQYLSRLEKVFPDKLAAELAHFAVSPLPGIADAAARRQIAFAMLGRTLDLRFTAVDGREVDLSLLRGKIVLIDFWATWCGPCIAELPNVVATYKQYHDRGFEVIGVALENAQLRPADTSAQAVAKLEQAKKRLTDFTAQHEMPWPQYFDGKYWKNDIASRYGISAIPAMFLLDQEGRLVSTNARGEKLEAEVKRLLKL